MCFNLTILEGKTDKMLGRVQAPGSKRKKYIYFKDATCNIPGLIFTKFKGLEGWPKGKVDCWLKKKILIL